jgi:branched-chain amino acid transport system ATP-binding protein
LLPHDGRIAMDTLDMSALPAWKRHALGIGFVPEGRQIFAGMTVDENLRVGGYLRPAARVRESLNRVYTLFPRLAERRKQIANTMSGGEQQMVAVGRALMDEPRLLVIDEVSWGLSPRLVETVFESLVFLRKSGIAILQAEQSVHMALQHADRVHVMATGQIILSDSASAFKDGSKLIENYIG